MDGERCRAWAVRPEKGGRGPEEVPLCSAHGGLRQRGEVRRASRAEEWQEEMDALREEVEALDIYGDEFDRRELAIMMAILEQSLPEGELMLARVVLRRMLGMMRKEELNVGAKVDLGDKLIKGADRVMGMAARHEEMQKVGGDDEEIPGWMAHALDALGKKWNLDL